MIAGVTSCVTFASEA